MPDDQPAPVRRARRRARAAAFASMVVLAVAIAGCNLAATPTDEPVPSIVSGPLCADLPRDREPGSPFYLQNEPLDEALEFLPVATIVEAGMRTSDFINELQGRDVTLLIPTDDAVEASMTQDTIDELLLFRPQDMWTFLGQHVIEGLYTKDELIAAGTVTTMAGTTITVTAAGELARFDDRAETVCADYQILNARMHIIDNVLGPLPEPSQTELPEGN